MQNPLVALIIPIYNVKDYLKECLDSVLNQTYQNLQIILVDDASNDGSFEIAKEYFQKDPRITLLCHKQNLGLSATRNTGLDYLSSLSSSALTSSGGGGSREETSLKAEIKEKTNFETLNSDSSLNLTSDSNLDLNSDLDLSSVLDLSLKLNFNSSSSPTLNPNSKPLSIASSSLEIHSHPNTPKDPPKYIHFLDSDDYLSLDCISECVKLAYEKGVDLIFYGSENFIDSQSDLKESLNHEGILGLYKDIEEGKIYSSLQILENHIRGNYLAFSWGCQIDFEIMKNLRFFEGIMAEDALFASILLSQACSASFLNRVFYHRRIRSFSITDFDNQHTKETLPPSLNDICQAISDTKDAKIYYLAYSSAYLCHELYLHFFIKNQYSKGVLDRVNDFIFDRIQMAFEALHFEADPRNARAKLKDLEFYSSAIKPSSKIAYHFPKVFKVLKGIKKKLKNLA